MKNGIFTLTISAAIALAGAASSLAVPAGAPVYTFCEIEDNDICTSAQVLDAQAAVDAKGEELVRDCLFLTGKLQKDCVWDRTPKCSILVYDKPGPAFDEEGSIINGQVCEQTVASGLFGELLGVEPIDGFVRVGLAALQDAFDGSINGLSQNDPHRETGEVTLKVFYNDGNDDGQPRGDALPDDSYVFRFENESDAIRVAFAIPEDVTSVDLVCCNDTGTIEVCYDVDFYETTNLLPNRAYCVTVVGGLNEYCEETNTKLGWFDKNWVNIGGVDGIDDDGGQGPWSNLCVFSDSDGSLRFAVTGGGFVERMMYQEVFPASLEDDNGVGPTRMQSVFQGWRGFYDGAALDPIDLTNNEMVSQRAQVKVGAMQTMQVPVNSYPQGIDDGGELFWAPHEDQILLYTEEMQLPAWSITRVLFDSKNNLADPTLSPSAMHVVLEVDGVWYASETAFTHSLGSTQWEMHELDVHAERWLPLDADLGGSGVRPSVNLDLAGSTVAFPEFGTIGVFGIYIETTKGRGNVRIDNFRGCGMDRGAGDCDFDGLDDQSQDDFNFILEALNILGGHNLEYRVGASTKDASAEAVLRFPLDDFWDDGLDRFYGRLPAGRRSNPVYRAAHGVCGEYCIKIQLAEHVDPGSRPEPTQPSGAASIADQNADGIVNAADLALLLSYWGTTVGE